MASHEDVEMGISGVVCTVEYSTGRVLKPPEEGVSQEPLRTWKEIKGS
jgi:hypothetical protein